jgi:hypothetical protein
VAARFVAARRGSRITGHKAMTDIKKGVSKKKAKPKKKPSK